MLSSSIGSLILPKKGSRNKEKDNLVSTTANEQPTPSLENRKQKSPVPRRLNGKKLIADHFAFNTPNLARKLTPPKKSPTITTVS